MSTTYDDENTPDLDRVEQQMEQGVRRCRMVVRKGRQLLELSQTQRSEHAAQN